jgi:hypothetical protein
MCAEIDQKLGFGVLKIKPPSENTLALAKKLRISTKLLKKKKFRKKIACFCQPRLATGDTPYAPYRGALLKSCSLTHTPLPSGPIYE